MSRGPLTKRGYVEDETGTEVRGDVPLRMLVLHAHPDDESILTGGTIAKALRDGVDVRVLTFTLGEEGEVIGERWSQLVAGAADQLGGYRISELTAALAALTPAGRAPVPPRFLGGAGRWRDSGMAGTPSAENPRALAQADPRELTAALAAELFQFAPDVVLTYDVDGGYGHPDHRTVHAIGASALDYVAYRDGPRPRVYESVTQRSALAAGLSSVTQVPAGWRLPAPGELPSYPDDRVNTEIDVSGVYAAKVAALAAHATQVTVAPSGTEFALSNNVLQPILPREHFIRVDDGARAGVIETDLFAGLS